MGLSLFALSMNRYAQHSDQMLMNQFEQDDKVAKQQLEDAKYGKEALPEDEEVLGWNNKGTALSSLGMHEIPLQAFDKAIQLTSKYRAIDLLT